MARADTIHRRLPGTGYSILHRHRMYEGPDHLLQVAFTGYSESYKRFYYADIQAFTLRRTPGWIGWGVLWGSLATVFLVSAIAADGGGRLLLLGGGGIFGLVCVLSLLRGPSAICEVHTAVQRERLRSLNRMRRARRVIDRLKPRIEAAQGLLPREELPRLIAELRQRTVDAPPVIPPFARLP